MIDSFILYTDYRDKLQCLNTTQLGELFKAILEYEYNGLQEVPEITDPVVIAIFGFIKCDLDKNYEKYQEQVKKQSENGKKGAIAKTSKAKPNQATLSDPKPNQATLSDAKRPLATLSDPKHSDNDNDNDIKKKDIPNGISKEKEESFSTPTPKQPKHVYGEYKHICLTDSELKKLEEDYGAAAAQEAIDYLDEYIEYKGYKANSHYLAIRKWVFKALEEHSRDKPGISQMPVYDDSNNPKFTDEDYETLLRELGHGG